MPLTIRVATEAEKVARDHVTYAAWGDRLTRAQYLEREQQLRAQSWAKVAMETWLLCDGDVIVSSCESLAMPSRVGDARGTAYGVASVFTEDQHRGHRYASRLVDEVSAALLARPAAQAVVLYSEVGAPVYERAGFVVAPIDEWFVAANPAAPPVGLVVDDELALAWPAPRHADDFVIEPSAAQLDWHLHRERYYATARNRRAPRRHRLRLDSSTLIVAADLKHGALIGLVAEVTPQTAGPLLRAGSDLAWQLGLDGLKLWAVDGIAPPDGVDVRPNDSSVCMIRSRHDVTWRRISRGAWV